MVPDHQHESMFEVPHTYMYNEAGTWSGLSATSAFCRTVWCFGNVASGAYIHGVVMEKRKLSQLHVHVCVCTSTAIIANLKHCTNNKTKQHNTPKAACICCMDILLGYIHVHVYTQERHTFF